MKGLIAINRVMIVDDAAFMRLALRRIFEKHGFEIVCEASNGKEAVELYDQLQPDIVTMDITMSIMTGLEALKEIRRKDPHAKVIMVTAMGQEPMVKEAIMTGAANFIIKPFKEQTVIDVISKIC